MITTIARRQNKCQKLLTNTTTKFQVINQQQQRHFFKQATTGTKHKHGIAYVEERVIGYSPAQLFEVVANVNNYKLFLPHVKDSKLVSHSQQGQMEGLLTVGYPPFYETYVSKIRVVYPHLVTTEAKSDKLFNHLVNRWELHPVVLNNGAKQSDQNLNPSAPIEAQATKLRFVVEFEFASQWYQTVANMFFSFLVGSMTDAFEKRCQELYGKPSMTTQKISQQQSPLQR